MPDHPSPGRACGSLPLALTPDEEAHIRSVTGSSAVPLSVQDVVEAYISRKVGQSWNNETILQRLRAAVTSQKSQYWKEGEDRVIGYRRGYQAMGYLAYQFPVYLMQAIHILKMLADYGLLSRRMAVADIGTGPGVIPVAISIFFRYIRDAMVTVYPVESSPEQIEAFSGIVPPIAEKCPGCTIKNPVRADIRQGVPPDIPGGLDLIVLQNVLNELHGLDLDRVASLLVETSDRLGPGGSLLLVEPADMANAINLRRVSRQLVTRGMTIFAPCPSMQGFACVPDTCWSFIELPPIQPTRLMRELSACADGYRYTNTDIKFAYAILRKEGGSSRRIFTPSHRRVSVMQTLPSRIGSRVTVTGAVMSGDLGDVKHHVFKVCDGSCKVPAFAILPAYHVTPATRTLLEARYGDIVTIERALVRFNPHYNSVNLFLNRMSRVTREGTDRQNRIAH